jgi:hypothetical protein
MWSRTCLIYVGFVVRWFRWALIAQSMSRRTSQVLELLALAALDHEHSINTPSTLSNDSITGLHVHVWYAGI